MNTIKNKKQLQKTIMESNMNEDDDIFDQTKKPTNTKKRTRKQCTKPDTKKRKYTRKTKKKITKDESKVKFDIEGLKIYNTKLKNISLEQKTLVEKYAQGFNKNFGKYSNDVINKLSSYKCKSLKYSLCVLKINPSILIHFFS